MNNLSNNTNKSTALVLQESLFISILSYVDFVNRISSILIFAGYFTLVFFNKKLQNKNLFYVHHSNFVGFLFCLMYIFYFSSNQPNFTDPNLNDLYCKLTEIAWSMLKYLRPFSLLIVALYRFLGVFYNNFFKKINKSKFYIFLPVFVVWMFTIVVFLSTKFGLQTTYGSLYCIDGYSNIFENRLTYLILTSFISIFLPFSSILIIYIAIRIKINTFPSNSKIRRLAHSTASIQPVGFETKISSISAMDDFSSNKLEARPNSSSHASKKKSEMSKNKKFNEQLIAMGVCYLMCFLVSFVLNFRYIIPNFNVYFYYYRQLLRILNILFQSMVPIISLYNDPHLNISINNFICRVLKKNKET